MTKTQADALVETLKDFVLALIDQEYFAMKGGDKRKASERFAIQKSEMLSEALLSAFQEGWFSKLRLKDTFHEKNGSLEYIVTDPPGTGATLRAAVSDGNLYDMNKKYVETNCLQGSAPASAKTLVKQ